MVVDLAKFRQTRSLSLSLTLGERIALARKNQGDTQEQVARKASCDRSVVSKWETGTLRPQPQDIVVLADALHAPDLLSRFCSECPVCQYGENSRPKPAA